MFKNILYLPAAKCRQFLRSECGNASVESVFWVPFFLFTLLAIGQFAMIFYGRAVTLEVAQIATRAFSVGELKTSDEVAAFVQQQMADVSSQIQVVSNVSDGMITTIISLPAGDFGGPLRSLTDLGGFDIQVVAQQTKEI